MSSVALSQEARPAMLLDGARSTLRLQHVGQEWTLAGLDGDGGEATLGRSQYAWWGELRQPRQGDWILLRDGGQLMADILSLDAQSLGYGLDPFNFGPFSPWTNGDLPRSMVAGVIWRSPANPRKREQLFRDIRSPTAAGDLVILRNADAVSGRATSLAPLIIDESSPPIFDTSTGESRSERNLHFETASRGIQVSLALIQALALNDRAEAIEPSAAAGGDGAWLGFADGSLLRAQRLERSEEVITLHLSDEVAVRISLDDFQRQLTYVEPANPRLTYLDELRPISYRHLPLLDRELPYQRNRNVLLQPLIVGGARFHRGLGMPSASRLAFDIPDDATQFVSQIAVDDAAERRGNVRFRVFLEDPSGQWSAAFESTLMQGGDPPADINIKLEQANRLALLVDYGQRGDVRDYANWIAPRFVIGETHAPN